MRMITDGWRGGRVKVGRSTVTFPTGMLGSVRIDALPRDIDPAAPAGRSGEIPPPAHQPDEATHADLAAELLVAVAKGVRGEDQGGYGARERAGTLRWWWDLGRAAEQIGEDERDAVLARMRVAAPSSAASDEGGGVEGVAQPLHVAAHAGDLWSTRYRPCLPPRHRYMHVCAIPHFCGSPVTPRPVPGRCCTTRTKPQI